jgi:hypothetical protein
MRSGIEHRKETVISASLLAWFEARDLFLGQNYVSRHLHSALQLASQCEHEDAQWLCCVVTSAHRAKEELLKQGDDPRAMVFVAVLSDEMDFSLIRRAAVAGSFLAQGFMAHHCDGNEKMMWAESAAAGGDPRGLHELAVELEVVDCERSISLHKQAAELGWVQAQFDYGLSLSEDDPERYWWWLKTCSRSDDFLEDLLDALQVQLSRFEVYGDGKTVFAIGEGIEDNLCVVSKTVFDICVSKARFSAATLSVKLYKTWCNQAREAIVLWILLAKRNRDTINSDVRRLIAKMVWNNRNAWAKNKKN